MKYIFHIDFNSYFATVEQQANPRLRGKAIGVTGGDRLDRTVIGAASVEAKKRGVKTGMTYYEARKFCPEIILVKGDSDKYLECTKRFLNILKDFSPTVEVFSIDECFLEIPPSFIMSMSPHCHPERSSEGSQDLKDKPRDSSSTIRNDKENYLLNLAHSIKNRIHKEIGEWIQCSIGISYNKFMAKLAGSLYKPNGLVAILDQPAAQIILDQVELDAICGIGFRIKQRLNNMAIFNFSQLRKVSLEYLIASFKNHEGHLLYNMARGIDQSKLVTFYEKEQVKSVGHRLTLSHDTDDPDKIKQVLLKLSELVAHRLRVKNLVGKTVTIWFRYAFNSQFFEQTGARFAGDQIQTTIEPSNDGLTVFKAGWKLFLNLWDYSSIRMIGISISNLKPKAPANLTFLEESLRQEKIVKTLDSVNDRFGAFTLQRAVLLGSHQINRMPNPFLSDRRFKL